MSDATADTTVASAKQITGRTARWVAGEPVVAGFLIIVASANEWISRLWQVTHLEFNCVE